MRLNKKQKNRNHYNQGNDKKEQAKVKKPEPQTSEAANPATRRTEDEKRYDIDAGLS